MPEPEIKNRFVGMQPTEIKVELNKLYDQHGKVFEKMKKTTLGQRMRKEIAKAKMAAQSMLALEHKRIVTEKLQAIMALTEHRRDHLDDVSLDGLEFEIENNYDLIQSDIELQTTEGSIMKYRRNYSKEQENWLLSLSSSFQSNSMLEYEFLKKKHKDISVENARKMIEDAENTNKMYEKIRDEQTAQLRALHFRKADSYLEGPEEEAFGKEFARVMNPSFAAIARADAVRSAMWQLHPGLRSVAEA